MAGNNESNSSNNYVPIAPATKETKALSTEDILKQCSEALCNEILNNRNFENPWINYLSPDVVTIHETTPVAHGRAQLVEGLRKYVALMPDYRAEILSSTAVINEKKGTATVYLHLLLSGMPDGIRRESVNVLTWKRRSGEWQITEHSGMRGPPPDSSMFSGF